MLRTHVINQNDIKLVKSAADGTEILPAAEPGSNDQAPLAQVGFYCGGEVDFVQFRIFVQRGGWKSFSELRSAPSRSGVSTRQTPLRVSRTSNCNRSMQPTAVTSVVTCHRWGQPPRFSRFPFLTAGDFNAARELDRFLLQFPLRLDFSNHFDFDRFLLAGKRCVCDPSWQREMDFLFFKCAKDGKVDFFTHL